MATSADPNDVIQLPRMRPGDLATLILELASTAKGTIAALEGKAESAQKQGARDDVARLPAAVPERVIEALDDMEATRGPLVAALRKPEIPDGLTAEQRALDTRLNAAWRCVRMTFELGAERATMRGDEALAARCREAQKRVLPQGLAFISLVGREEYTLSDTYLGVLNAESADLFRALPGGAELLRDLWAVHEEYGRAFYITAPAPLKAGEALGVAAATSEAAEATREYVAAVLGCVRRADPRTRALAERLLAPLSNYGRALTTPSADDAPRPAPQPLEPAQDPTG